MFRHEMEYEIGVMREATLIWDKGRSNQFR